MFGLQYLKYILLEKEIHNTPLLIHRAVNFQIVATMKIISCMKRRNSDTAGASGVCVAFPWPPLTEAMAVVDRCMWVPPHHVLSAPHLKHSLLQHLLPHQSVKVLMARGKSSFDGEKVLRGCSSSEDDLEEVFSTIPQSPGGPSLRCTQQPPLQGTSFWLFLSLLPLS